MELNIASIEIEPKRHTFGHIAERFGEDRPASRYEEAIYDGQATENFHYRPQWEPEFEIYDVRRTKIVMSDWYKLLDPRKFHYMSYVSTRAKDNGVSEQNFEFIEKRGLVSKISQINKDKIYKYLTPLRHYEYGANLNNLTIVSRGYGTALDSASLFYATDSLGMAQHITKIILLLSDNDISKLDEGKNDWLNDPIWQGLRKAVEDILIIKDPIELLIAQNVIFDGIVLPLLINNFSKEMADTGEITIGMLTEFITSWQEETVKWLDSIVKVMAEESVENKSLLEQWAIKYIGIIYDALEKLSEYSLNGDEILSSLKNDLILRLNKNCLLNI
jgi:phenol hydroxylase P1 protein